MHVNLINIKQQANWNSNWYLALCTNHIVNNEGDFFRHEQSIQKRRRAKTMGTIPSFPKSTKPTEPAIRKKKSKKGWFWGCGGCLVLFILIIIGIQLVQLVLQVTLAEIVSKETNKPIKSVKLLKIGDLEVTVNSVETMKSVGPSLAPTNAKGIFVVADVTIKNKGKEALTIDSSMFKLKSGDKTFEADNTGSMSANQSDNGSIENSFFLQRINPE
ncbi:Telomeric repeat-binding factor 2 [Staphylococcus aureus]|uniref:Telomeric repeat-binding factor 2 n=1 Tax=Staphylococcus aureus TaxID=1280 RepID=A0A380DWZ0_STAAU|nr:Telomeric repeat-binding factor 2 [Staphylococcus aureus]